MARMTVFLGVTAVAAAALLGAAVSPARSEDSATRAAGAAIVAWVVDGDTLDLRDGRRVRLLQVDTPEIGTGECYSHKARAELVALSPPGTSVTLEVDPALDRVDRYGRILRYLGAAGRNLNVELVRRGAAAPYFYRGERGAYAAVLLGGARAARAAKRGLWGACPGTPLDPLRAIETGSSGSPAGSGSATGVLPVAGGSCDPSYAGVCIPPSPPDLDCVDIRARGWAPVRVVGADPHRLDGDGDGWGCE